MKIKEILFHNNISKYTFVYLLNCFIVLFFFSMRQTKYLPIIRQMRDHADIRKDVCGSSAGNWSPSVWVFNRRSITSDASAINFSSPTAKP